MSWYIECNQRTVDDTGLLESPFFRALSDGSMTLEQFRASQEQFYFIIPWFGPSMGYLLGRLPIAERSMGVLANIHDEHGNGRLDAAHHVIFTDFVTSLQGESFTPRAGDDGGPAAHTWVNVVRAVCMFDPLPTAFGFMGSIEYTYGLIASAVYDGVVGRGWSSPHGLRHHLLHKEVEEEHAEAFYKEVGAGDQDRIQGEQGIQLGVHIFDQLFRSFYTQSPS
ncbi:iron-containing redox enzyme family protein [Streptomyces sp. NPDC050844]|uniref:iron-containing redox enzyme family protein n=1 Tax=Streptomyces sp. NPDC050844 TaxID=3155790 RepID=UPI0033F9C2F3